ncbi:MAG: tRNA (N6-isopentenyl adenosine(37)-C2)-methylthiotransferase MiaB [Treponemataceae bacterium]|nr:tRNA (N6-isopentenyl adenosine(37)-C2)-methylthiotransferase MiaB [Treponemataceae bacterium]
MKYFFETYGCQMNVAESASTEQQLVERGWTQAQGPEDADLVIINTCSVRATAENRIHGRLGWYSTLRRERKAAEKSDFTLVVMGCMAQRLMDGLKKQFPVVDYVVGNFQKKFFDEIFKAVEEGRHLDLVEETPAYTFAPLSYEKGSFSAYVPIMHGCNNFCTYCIVPYVRGREISRNPKEILAELDQLSKNNVKEITLLGQNVNSYCWNLKKNESNTRGNLKQEELEANPQDYMFFPELLKLIAEHLKKTNSSIGWVRFMSSHPKDLSDQLIKVIAEEDLICHHIHLPVQHGSDAILQRMNRHYTREHYLDVVKKIRQAIPDVSLTTDILLGFPGESEKDFMDTVDLMKTVNYESAFMYYYNPRQGTPAASYEDQIPMDEKKCRLKKIIDMQQEITKTEMSKQIGKTVQVLAESVSHNDERELIGRTQRDEPVVFAAEKSLIGSFVDVRIDELSGITFRGTLQYK